MMFARLSFRTKVCVLCSVLLVVALLAIGACLPSHPPASNPGGGEGMSSGPASGSVGHPHAGEHHRRPGLQVGDKATEACTVLAPRTLQAYLRNPRTHVDDWFAPGADGLQTKPDGLLKQPLDSFTGAYMNGSDHATAVCGVNSGLESPWIITYRYNTAYGWLATSVQGPANGAYNMDGKR